MWATICNVSSVSLTICELTSSDVEVRTCRTRGRTTHETLQYIHSGVHQQGQQAKCFVLFSIRHGGRACVSSFTGTLRRDRDGMMRVC